MPNPFDKPTTPKNSLQLLQWLIFEPVLLERYEKTLNKIRTLWILLKAILVNFFIIIIPLTLVLYAISVVILAGFDLPLLFPLDNPINIGANEIFVQQWQTYSTFWEKIYLFASFENYKSLKGLAFGLGVGLGVGSAIGLTVSLAGNVAECLAIGLGISLGVSLAKGLAVGGDLAFALAGSLAFSLVGGLTGNLAGGLKGGLIFGLAGGLALGLVVKKRPI